MRPLIVIAFLFVTYGAAARPDTSYHYDGTLTIDPASGHIEADWRITVLDDSQSTVTFLLRNTLSDIEASGSDVQNIELGQQEGLAEFHSISISLATGEKHRVINLSYDGVLLPEPMDNRINAITPDRVELNVDSFWLPMDSSFQKKLTSDLTVLIGTGWQGVTTGITQPIDNGVRLINDEPDLDISFTLAKSFHISESDGFTIYDQRAEQEGTENLLAAVRHCVSYLNTRFGKNAPLPKGKLLITERPSSGYARLNYIVLTDIADTEPGPLTRFVCHEFAHYWSRGANFNTVENWLNEAFAEYIGLMAVRDRFGSTAYDDMLRSFRKQIETKELPPIWRPGDTSRGPYLVQYRKGPLVLAQLEKDIGSTSFLHFLRAFLEQPARTTPKLLAILESVSGESQRARFEKALASSELPIAAPQVMLLGTFHFQDAGLDAVKTDAFNIMSVASQEYLVALSERLAGFAPTRILLEYETAKDDVFNQRYSKYLADDYELPANEIYQLGFRVAKLAGLDQVHGFDERTVSWAAEPMFEYGKTHDSPEMVQLEALIEQITSTKNRERKTMNLQELLLLENSAASERENMDLYLLTNAVGAADGYVGADAAASWWHRNFRMYANIQQAAKPGERVLAIAGAGHTAILRQLLAIDQRLQPVDVTRALVGESLKR